MRFGLSMGLLLLIQGLAATTPIFAKKIVLGKEMESMVFEQIPEPPLEIVKKGTKKEPTLIGGDPVSPGEWPGVFYTSQGNSRCTGTLVASDVLASAAHCMANGGGISLRYKGEVISGKCTHAPDYRGNSTADWALCKLEKKIPDNIAESINTNPSGTAVGQQVRLMGYGCIKVGGSGGNDGILRSNPARVTAVPVVAAKNYDTVTYGSAALCYGDSGGPSFVYDTDGKRYVLAVNSRGNIRNTSYLSSWWVPSAQEFIAQFSKDQKTAICGVDKTATGCRQGDKPIDLPEACLKFKQTGGLERIKNCAEGASPVVEECEKVMNELHDCFDARFPVD